MSTKINDFPKSFRKNDKGEGEQQAELLGKNAKKFWHMINFMRMRDIENYS